MSTRWDDLPMSERERRAAEDDAAYAAMLEDRRRRQYAKPCTECGSLTDPAYGPRCADCAGGAYG